MTTTTVLTQVLFFHLLLVLAIVSISTPSPAEPVPAALAPAPAVAPVPPAAVLEASQPVTSLTPGQPAVAVSPPLSAQPAVAVSPPLNAQPPPLAANPNSRVISAPGVTGTVTQHKGEDGSIITVSRFNGNIPSNAFPSFANPWGNMFNPGYPQQFQGNLHPFGYPTM